MHYSILFVMDKCECCGMILSTTDDLLTVEEIRSKKDLGAVPSTVQIFEYVISLKLSQKSAIALTLKLKPS